MEELNKTHETLHEKILSLNKEVTLIEKNKNQLDSLLNDKNKTLLELDKKHSELQENSNNLKEQNELLKNKIDQEKTESERLKNTLNSLSLDLNNLECLILEKNNLIQKLKSDTVNLNTEKSELENNIEKLKNIKIELELSKKDLKLTLKEKEQLDSDLLKNETHLKALLMNIEEKKIQLNKITQEKDTLSEELKLIKDSIQDFILKNEDLNKKNIALTQIYYNEKNKLRHLKESEQNDIKKIRDKCVKHIINLRKFTKIKAKKILTESKSQALHIIQNAKIEATRIKESIQRSTDEEKKKILSEAHLELKNKKIELEENLKKELAQKKFIAEESMHKLHFELNKKLEFDLEEKKKKEAEKKEEYIKAISHCIEDLVFSESSLMKKINEVEPDSILSFKAEVNQILSTIYNESHPTVASLKGKIKFNPQALVNEKKFWRKVTWIAAASLAIIGLGGLGISEWDRIKGVVQIQLEEQKVRSEQNLKIFQEERAEKYVFIPELTEDFKPSYTENIIYTKNYLLFKRDQQQAKQWILYLNDFFKNDLGLNERAVVRFIPLENQLLNELSESRRGLTPQTLDQGINNMKNIEQKALDEMSIVLEGRTNLEKLINFENKVYIEWLSSEEIKRKPSSQKTK